jgi:hypothetical protein
VDALDARDSIRGDLDLGEALREGLGSGDGVGDISVKSRIGVSGVSG